MAAVAVWFVFRKVSVPGILPVLRSADLWALAASIASIIAASLLNAWRWKVLLRAPNLGMVKYLYFIFVGHFFNLFMPSSLASEAVKVVAFGKRYGNLQQNIGITLVARGMGFIAQILIGSAAFCLYAGELMRTGMMEKLQLRGSLIGALAAAAAIGIGALFRFRSVLARQPWVQAMLEAARDRTLMAQTALLTAGIQILSAFSGYCLFLSVYPGSPLGKVVVLILVVQAILLLPFSMGGVGVREYLSLLFFSDLGGMPREAVFASNLLGYVPLILMAAVGGMWILFRSHGGLIKPLWDRAGRNAEQDRE